MCHTWTRRTQYHVAMHQHKSQYNFQHNLNYLSTFDISLTLQIGPAESPLTSFLLVLRGYLHENLCCPKI